MYACMVSRNPPLFMTLQIAYLGLSHDPITISLIGHIKRTDPDVLIFSVIAPTLTQLHLFCCLLFSSAIITITALLKSKEQKLCVVCSRQNQREKLKTLLGETSKLYYMNHLLAIIAPVIAIALGRVPKRPTDNDNSSDTVVVKV